MVAQQSFVILGNGIAGATAAEILRAEDRAADITVITDDPCPVFYRPALKDYLAGKVREEKLWARPISFYPERRVRFLTGKVVSLQPGEHTIQLQSGQRIGYSRLLLAHGASATTLRCSGLDLAGVTTLRTVADYQRVLADLDRVNRVVVVGSGTLALESIETLRHRSYKVTHLLRRQTLWSEVLDPVASDLVLQQEQRDGVDIRVEQEIAEIFGKQGRATGVLTTTGQHISCELVLLGIGIEPNIDFVKAAGIACGRGVKVDAGMRTNVPDIYAAGDLVETGDPITAKARVIGQWYPAIQQARAAAYSMLDVLDTEHAFRFGNFYNACMLYGLDFASVGISVAPRGETGYQELVADPQPRQYQKVILKNGLPVGMVALGDRRSVLTYKRAIDHQVDLASTAAQLFDPRFSLQGWLDKQGVPPAILGVNRDGMVTVSKLAYAGVLTKRPTISEGIRHQANKVQEAWLVPIAPPELLATLGKTYLSQTRVTTIGRSEGASFSIQHHSISRRHAEISYANAQYILRDLGSKNGTRLNGHRVEPQSYSVLKAGDKLDFGQASVVFQLQEVEPKLSVVLKQKDLPLLPDLLINAEMPGEAPDGKTIPASFLATAIEQSQPSLNGDGSLSLPGLRQPIPPETVAQMRQQPALVAIYSGQPLIKYLFADQPIILGRHPRCDMVLTDMSISNRHAEVFAESYGFCIRDLGSSNGVSVNHQRITGAYQLAHGECITLGTVALYFINYLAQRRSSDDRAGSDTTQGRRRAK